MRGGRRGTIGFHGRNDDEAFLVRENVPLSGKSVALSGIVTAGMPARVVRRTHGFVASIASVLPAGLTSTQVSSRIL